MLQDPRASGPAEGNTLLKPAPGGGRLATPRPPKPPSPEASELPPLQAVPSPVAHSDTLPVRDPNPLESAAATLLALATKLRMAAHHPDPDGLRSQIVGEIKTFENRTRDSGIDPKTISSARYALCTVLDEAVLNTPWGAASVWRTQSLLSTFHNDTRGGENFFVLLKETGQDPTANLSLLELLYVCLSLGFQGRFRVLDRGEEQLAELRERLFQIIRSQRGPFERELSPRWQGTHDHRNQLVRLVPLWVVGALAGVVLLGLFFGLLMSVNAASDPVYGQLASVRLPHKVIVERPIATPAPVRPQIVQHITINNPAPVKPTRPTPRLQELLAPEIAQHLVSLEEGSDHVTVVVLGDVLFRSGSADVELGYRDIFRRIGEALDEVKGRIIVTGHTDNVPIRSLRFPSNWHLSRERATQVVTILSGSIKTPGRLRAEGKADADPRAPNDSPENRALNRRVEVQLLLPNPS